VDSIVNGGAAKAKALAQKGLAALKAKAANLKTFFKGLFHHKAAPAPAEDDAEEFASFDELAYEEEIPEIDEEEQSEEVEDIIEEEDNSEEEQMEDAEAMAEVSEVEEMEEESEEDQVEEEEQVTEEEQVSEEEQIPAEEEIVEDEQMTEETDATEVAEIPAEEAFAEESNILANAAEVDSVKASDASYDIPAQSAPVPLSNGGHIVSIGGFSFSLDFTAVLGIAIGVSVAAIFLIAGCVYAIRQRRFQKRVDHLVERISQEDPQDMPV